MGLGLQMKNPQTNEPIKQCNVRSPLHADH